MMNKEEVTQTLNRMFHSVSQDVPGHVTMAAPEETCSLMLRLFDRSHSGCVSARSLQTALIALSADNLLLKFRGLVSVTRNSSGSVSRSGLRSLLQDLSQVPAAVQEEVVFGSVEAAVRSCFDGVLTPTASEEHMMSWLQSEPRLLLWLPTLYRLSVGQNISHNVRCHTCKTLPITGLRYRCMKCVNVHVCQSCFLTDRQTRKHKIHHPVLEFCTQPTWRESLSSLVQSARHSLLPRRHTQREAVRQRLLMWAEPAETQDRAPPPSDASSRLADPAHSPPSDGGVSHDASGRRPSPPRCSTKALQTDEEMPSQQASLLTEVRNLQRDRWLLEQQLQAWRLTVQSEQGVLEDRCSEMEVTMETLRQHNTCLQGMLTQALNKMEAQTHANNTPEHVENTEGGNITPSSNSEEEDEEELMEAEEEWSEDELQTPPPTIHRGSPLSHDQHWEEEESADEVRLHHPIGPQDRPKEAELHGQDTCPSEEGGGGDCGKCSPEKLLQETVDRLKTEMETDGWTERQTGEIKGAELLQAADQVGRSVQQLVDEVRTE
ncbi:dystrotelin isoform X2 [Acanthochromis polyacanthus]|uniref:dystrotelin isoform X2 n=1 Tax=Acanthochromis polyacanthus TaxID=80966 RepID=UPI0022343EDA|nr:dystrotelin isoform X2 [Acanthochromis polyacanthus]